MGRHRARGGNTEVFFAALEDFGYSSVITLRIKNLHLDNLRSHGEFFLRAGRNRASRIRLARELIEHSRLPATGKV